MYEQYIHHCITVLSLCYYTVFLILLLLLWKAVDILYTPTDGIRRQCFIPQGASLPGCLAVPQGPSGGASRSVQGRGMSPPPLDSHCKEARGNGEKTNFKNSFPIRTSSSVACGCQQGSMCGLNAESLWNSHFLSSFEGLTRGCQQGIKMTKFKPGTLTSHQITNTYLADCNCVTDQRKHRKWVDGRQGTRPAPGGRPPRAGRKCQRHPLETRRSAYRTNHLVPDKRETNLKWCLAFSHTKKMWQSILGSVNARYTVQSKCKEHIQKFYLKYF